MSRAVNPSSVTIVGGAYVYTRSGTTWTQQSEVSDPNPKNDDGFGNSVALSGNTGLIGAGDQTVVAKPMALRTWRRSWRSPRWQASLRPRAPRAAA